MADGSTIEWLARPGTKPATWNPVRGCTRVSEGCRGCYAEGMAARFSKQGMWGHGYAEMRAGQPRWTGKVSLVEDQLTLPLHWREPRTIFANSTSDLFHERLPDEAIDRIFAVMALCPQHTFIVLTKRPERMRNYFADDRDRAMQIGVALGNMLDGDWIWGDGKKHRDAIEGLISLAHGMAPDDEHFSEEELLPLPNVWLGTSIEDQATADERVPLLLETPAAIRFVSAEPLLGPLDLTKIKLPNGDILNALTGEVAPLDWVIVGGESGPNARPMHPDWARSLRDQCVGAGVPFFFKQWGEFAPEGLSREAWLVRPDSSFDPDPLPNGIGRHHKDGYWRAYRVGKKAAGALLDGREWRQWPGNITPKED